MIFKTSPQAAVGFAALGAFWEPPSGSAIVDGLGHGAFGCAGAPGPQLTTSITQSQAEFLSMVQATTSEHRKRSASLRRIRDSLADFGRLRSVVEHGHGVIALVHRRLARR